MSQWRGNKQMAWVGTYGTGVFEPSYSSNKSSSPVPISLPCCYSPSKHLDAPLARSTYVSHLRHHRHYLRDPFDLFYWIPSLAAGVHRAMADRTHSLTSRTARRPGSWPTQMQPEAGPRLPLPRQHHGEYGTSYYLLLLTILFYNYVSANPLSFCICISILLAVAASMHAGTNQSIILEDCCDLAECNTTLKLNLGPN
jgi:hypothetical protein